MTSLLNPGGGVDRCEGQPANGKNQLEPAITILDVEDSSKDTEGEVYRAEHDGVPRLLPPRLLGHGLIVRGHGGIPQLLGVLEPAISLSGGLAAS
jgi:hypothetical protein